MRLITNITCVAISCIHFYYYYYIILTVFNQLSIHNVFLLGKYYILHSELYSFYTPVNNKYMLP